MFNEYKAAYKECADLADDWNRLSYNELCNKYNECKESNDPIADSYFSALMYKTWDKVEMVYRTRKFDFLTCYDIVVDTWLYVANSRIWKNKESELYNNPDAARIAFCTVLRSKERTMSEKINGICNKANVDAVSIDERVKLYDDFILSADAIVSDRYDFLCFENLVKMFFDKKNYFAAILIDLIAAQGHGFDHKPYSKHATGYNRRELIEQMRRTDDQYCRYFASQYKVDYKEVLDCRKFIFNCTQDRLARNTDNTLSMLGKKYFHKEDWWD